MPAVGRASFPASAGLPSGGVSGRVLTKTSGSDYAGGWLYASPIGPPVHIAHRWYDARTSLGAGQTSGSVSLAVNTTIYVPVYISGGLRVSALAVATTATASSAQLTFGISSTGSSGTPGSLLGTATVAASTTAAVQMAYPNTPLAVAQGWNWLSVGSNLAVGVDGCLSGGINWPYSRTGGLAAPAANTVSACGLLDSASAVPANNPTVTVLTGSAPLIFFYIAAMI